MILSTHPFLLFLNYNAVPFLAFSLISLMMYISNKYYNLPSIKNMGIKTALFFIKIYTHFMQLINPLIKYFNPVIYIPYKYKIKAIIDEDNYDYEVNTIKPEHFNNNLFATILHHKSGFEYRVFLKNMNELIRIQEALNNDDTNTDNTNTDNTNDNNTKNTDNNVSHNKIEHTVDHRNILFGNAIIDIKNREDGTIKEKIVEIPIVLLYIYAGPEGNFFENELMLEDRTEYLSIIFNEMLPRPYKAWRKIHKKNHPDLSYKWIVGDEVINDDDEYYNLRKVEIFTVDGEQIEYSFRV